MTTDAIQVRSRYKDTPAFTGLLGTYYGLMEVPTEFSDYEEPVGYATYVVKAEDVGFPDLISVKVFGIGNEDLWWIVAIANGIIDPENDLFVGQVLNIPTAAAVSNFLSR